MGKEVEEFSTVIRKMREIRGLTRKQAGVIFNLSHKTIEKLENGRGTIDEDRLLSFAKGYGFSNADLLKIQSGQYQRDITVNTKKEERCKKRRDRRFCRPVVTKECKVLRQLRLDRGLSQYELSKLCGFGRNQVGYYECGRINLQKKVINKILKVLNFEYEYFLSLIEVKDLRYEIIMDISKALNDLDMTSLSVVKSVINGFKDNSK
tara:strand:- start:697 stop:1317 length:621 start_codon:yes stop_codon:yes gene_type:complete